MNNETELVIYFVKHIYNNLSLLKYVILFVIGTAL